MTTILQKIRKTYPTYETALDAVRCLGEDVIELIQHHNRLRTQNVISRQRGLDCWTDDEVEVLCYRILTSGLEDYFQQKIEKKKLFKFQTTLEERDAKCYFVTVGFDDSKVTDANEVVVFNSVVDKVIATPSFTETQFSCEKFRGPGIHRHIHFLISAELPKSKVLQYVYEKVHKWLRSKDFVDVKPAIPSVHPKYIRGEKTEDKMLYVEKDRIWRREKNIREMI